MNVSPSSRRRFLKSALSAPAGVHLFHISGTKASGQILGANNRIRVGICGLRNRGSRHLSALLDQENVEVTTLIDIDESQFSAHQRQLRDRTGREASRIFSDIRWALEDPELDAVTIATCNHTHALYTILACQAGIDVYVETPMSHNLEEGRKVISAASHYRRIVQHGSQLRSSRRHAAEIAAVRSGRYGKLKTAKAIDPRPFPFAPPSQPRKPPPYINWDTWIGPAPTRRFELSLLLNNWRHFWDFGNGTIGDMGFHQLDIARWAVDREGLPTKVWALGGRYGHQTSLEAPNMFLAGFDFGDVSVIFESRNPIGRTASGNPEVANEYHTTDGVIRNGKFFPEGSETGESLKFPEESPANSTGNAFSRFLSAVRNRDPSICPASPEVAHQTCALCHLANIAYRMAKPAPFLSGRPNRIGDSPQARRSFDAISRDLASQGFNLATTQYQLSPALTIDPKTENFTGEHSGRANQLIPDQYRDPWKIPGLG